MSASLVRLRAQLRFKFAPAQVGFSRRTAVVLMCLAALAGCASLPDLKAFRQPGRARADSVRVLNQYGLLSPKQTAAALSRLKREGRTDLLEKHLALMQAVPDAPPLVIGNEARLLIDGPNSYRAMFSAIREARDHINLETYILEGDWLGENFAELLIKKQREGVQVNVLYDYVGSIGTPAEFFDRLRKQGVNIRAFNPVHLFTSWRLNHRDHRKILVVDGAVAFTGGINISSVYSRGSAGRRRGQASVKGGWRDTNIEIRGPAVAQFQKLFLETWERQHGEPLPARNYFPQLKPAGDKVVRVVASTPSDEFNFIYLSLLSAITYSERSIYLTMAYFIPGENVVEALKQAARRGVDVKLILPSFSDFWAVFHAGRSHYSDLMRAGVKIYERQDALLHAKTATIDGVWSTVGSANMDMRSFLHNDEVNAVVLNEDVGRQMRAMFDADLAGSVLVNANQWEARDRSLRLKEKVARLWEYWL